MKKLIPVILILTFILTACSNNYDINGTYTSKSDELDFSVVICDSFCMIDVTSTNPEGGTASAVINGNVSAHNDIVVITIDKHPGVSGTQFEFIYNERQGTLTNTSDGSILEKASVRDVSLDGSYAATDGNNDFRLTFKGRKCNLTVNSQNDNGQTATITRNGTVNIDENIINIKFKDKKLDDDIYRFIYSKTSDLIMNTSDGKIFTKIKEN